MASSTGLGCALVIGGSGFLGSHIVEALLKEPDCGPVHIVSRRPKQIFQDRVCYHSVDLSDAAAVDAKLREVQPKVIFHVASPRATDYLSYKAYQTTNVIGTRNLISSATQIPAIRAFVFTSSAGVIGGYPVIDADETAPLCDTLAFKPNFYHRSKAETERLVLETSQSGLATVSLRICLIYGERDNSLLPGLMAALDKNQTNIQLGENKQRYDFVYAGNAAKAHLLAAKALLNPSQARGKVDGEAFMITDGAPKQFWDAAHIAWRAAGDKTRYEDVTVIPTWFAMTLAHVSEWLFWVFTLGRATPTEVNINVFSHATQQYTYKIDKARERLGYNPVPDFEGGMQRAVAVYLEESGHKSKDK